MFTGLITQTAKVLKQATNKDGLTLTFERPAGWTDLQLGESIATDGVCLTVSALRPAEYDCYLMQETLSLTSFGKKIPERVNLERALQAGERFGGHFVQGHVDGLGTVITIDQARRYDLTVAFDQKYQNLVIHKGSITLNGVSLTVSTAHNNQLSVSLIPHTLEHTTLGLLTSGDPVNIEFDMIGKYIVKNMEARNAASN